MVGFQVSLLVTTLIEAHALTSQISAQLHRHYLTTNMTGFASKWSVPLIQ